MINFQYARAHDVADAVLYLAFYQSGLANAVTAGENKGVTLRHDFVARAGAARVEPLADAIRFFARNKNKFGYVGRIMDYRFGESDAADRVRGDFLKLLETDADKLSPEQILKREIGTGVPIIYKLGADALVTSKLDLAG